jgi:hypothetical protein
MYSNLSFKVGDEAGGEGAGANVPSNTTAAESMIGIPCRRELPVKFVLILKLSTRDALDRKKLLSLAQLTIKKIFHMINTERLVEIPN